MANLLDTTINGNLNVTGHIINGGVIRYDINNQGLTDTQKSNARTNIGAGTSNFNGAYSSLSGAPSTSSPWPTETQEIYWCTYGTTTGAEITAAIAANKYCVVKYNGHIYGNVAKHPSEGTNSNGRYYFTAFYGAYTRLAVTCDVDLNSSSQPVWSNNTKAFGSITEVKTAAGTHTTIDVTSGKAEFNVPTKTSHLTNDSGFVTSSGVTSVATSGTGLSGGTITSTGTITLDSSSAGNAAANKVLLRNAAGSIQTEKLAISSGTTTKVNMQYNSSENCIEFIFA